MRWASRFKAIRWFALLPLVAVIAAFAVPRASPKTKPPVEDTDNSLPIAKLLPDSPQDADDRTVRLVFLSRQKTERSEELHFALLNGSDTPISYEGWVPSSYATRPAPGHIDPNYCQELLVNDHWKKKVIEVCGVGLDEIRIRPGHGGRFNVYGNAKEPDFRIGVHYRRETGGSVRREEEIAWSPTITAEATPAEK